MTDSLSKNVPFCLMCCYAYVYAYVANETRL